MYSNKKYCLFPKPHLFHLLFLFYFISSIVKNYIFIGIKEEDNLSIPIFKLYIYVIGDLLAVIPYLIIKKKIKSKNIEKSNNNNKGNFNFIYNDIFAKKKKRIIINIFIICLFSFIGQISTIIFYLIEGNQKMVVKGANLNIIFVFNIIFLFLLSKFILDISFYMHHYFSLIIFIICLIVLVIIDCIAIDENNKKYSQDSIERKSALINSVLYIVIKIFTELLYSLENVICKVLFLKYYITPYFLLLMSGIIKFFFSIIFSIPLLFVKFRDKIIFSMFKDIFNEKINILYYIIYFINSFFYNILDYLIVDKFSPTHSAIAYILENLGIFIINAIQKDMEFDYHFGVRIIMYILLVIVSVIFNEFLVINICGLANNTKLFLEYKEKNDLSLIGEIFNENDFLSEANKEATIRTVKEQINIMELNDV